MALLTNTLAGTEPSETGSAVLQIMESNIWSTEQRSSKVRADNEDRRSVKEKCKKNRETERQNREYTCGIILWKQEKGRNPMSVKTL